MYSPSGSKRRDWRVGFSTRRRVGVVPGPGHPLPAEVVVGDVAVDEVVEEVAGAPPPVDPEVVGEERRGHQPRPVVHPTVRAELAHPRVDERIAGSAVAPGGEALGVVAPAPVAPGAVVRPGGVRPGRQHLVEEVAPAHLPHERLATGAVAGRRARRRRRTCTRSGGRRTGATSCRRRDRHGRRRSCAASAGPRPTGAGAPCAPPPPGARVPATRARAHRGAGCDRC